MKVLDGLKSLIGNLGNPNRDKRASLRYATVNIDDAQLMAAYEGNWIAAKIVDIPAGDCLRQWRKWHGEQKVKIIDEEQRLGLEGKLNEALTMSRLYGGAAIYIGTEQDVTEPLIPESIGLGDIKYLTVLTRRELQAGELNQDALSEYYGKPSYYTIAGTDNTPIHPSRFVILKGSRQADRWGVSGPTYGWGESVLKSTNDAIKNAGGTFANVASLVYEAKIDVVKVPNFMESLGDSEYEAALLNRFSLAAANKGINGMLIIDKDEDFATKSPSFGMIPDIMDRFALHCAAAADIPATRFMGDSASGLSATGEGDMDNYHDSLRSIQKLKIQPAMFLLDECLVHSAFGNYPEDVFFEWNPLEQMSEKEQAEIEKLRAETVKMLSELSPEVMPIDAIYEQQRRAGLFDDTDIATLEGYKKAIAEQNAVSEEF